MFIWSFSEWFNSLGLVNLFGHLKSETHENVLDDDAFIRMLVKDVNNAHNNIKIVEGVENLHLYDDERVAIALSSAVDRGVKIQFVLKPAMSSMR
jgi:hypothetical protein